MSTKFSKSGWKWALAVLAVTALASLYLRNTLAAGTPTPPASGGGVPDSGAQLLAVVDELKNTNQKLDALQKLLESGKVQVHATIDKDTK